jgi:hypothetical protein
LGAHPYDYWRFRDQNTTRATMLNEFIFDSFGLLEKIITYVKTKRLEFGHIEQCFEIYSLLFSPSITYPIWKIVFWPCNVKGRSICH